MFILSQNEFQDNDRENIHNFVNYWERFYTYSLPSYFDALCLGAVINRENLERLLRWKDPRFLSGQTAGSRSKIDPILEGLDTLNAFRRENSLDEFTAWALDILPDNEHVIYRTFLFHIARPIEYPIWDQHVGRSFAVLTNQNPCVNWAMYNTYRTWFDGMKRDFGCDNAVSASNLRKVKRLDSALMAYGQFLTKYSVC